MIINDEYFVFNLIYIEGQKKMRAREGEKWSMVLQKKNK